MRFLFCLGLLFVLIIRSTFATSKNCRWENHEKFADLKEDVLFKHNLSMEHYTSKAISVSNLPRQKILEDLHCLELVFKTSYSATAYYQNQGVDLLERLRRLIKRVQLLHNDGAIAAPKIL